MAGDDCFVDQTLRLQVHRALRQRITLYVRLTGLGNDHTGPYIDHHLAAGGGRGDVFEPAALELIHELADGVPRLVGTLAEAAMDSAAEQQKTTVALEHVHGAAETVLPPQMPEVTP
jgi:type II secretory pathway predicted ATPase ExeA